MKPDPGKGKWCSGTQEPSARRKLHCLSELDLRTLHFEEAAVTGLGLWSKISILYQMHSE